MYRTSDQTSPPTSTPVHTSVQTSRLVRQGCPHRPHRSRAPMYMTLFNHQSKTLNRYGQCGQSGHLNDSKGCDRPDLAREVRTVWTCPRSVVFHGNRRAGGQGQGGATATIAAQMAGATVARVLLGLGRLRVIRTPHFMHLSFRSLVPVGTQVGA